MKNYNKNKNSCNLYNNNYIIINNKIKKYKNNFKNINFLMLYYNKMKINKIIHKLKRCIYKKLINLYKK